MASTVTRPTGRNDFISLAGASLNIESTLFSGQTFRWRKHGEWYEGVISGEYVCLRGAGEGIEYVTSDDGDGSMASRLRDYFSLDVDLPKVYAVLSRDEELRGAVERYRGMRVLRQDPWETVLSFLCAQNSNVQRITRNVEDMCLSFGRPLSLGDRTRHSYPTPEALAEAGEQALRDLGLGYRARYVASAAEKVAAGEIDLMRLRETPFDDALETLMTLDGVGDKVANCIMLFCMEKPQAFPVDTHILQVLRERFPKPHPVHSSDIRRVREWAQEHFAPFAGYANHYLFHSRRVGRTPNV